MPRAPDLDRPRPRLRRSLRGTCGHHRPSCYAKAHGEYSAIEGGFIGEGIEDLTGGVITEIYASDILDREAFWLNDLMQVNLKFLLRCFTGIWVRGRESQGGILTLHA